MDGLGTAVGVISLGLELYSRISDYIDGMKCEQREISFARVQVKSLKASLDVLGTGLQKFRSLDALSEQHVKASALLVKENITSISNFLDTLEHQDTGHTLADLMKRKKAAQLPFQKVQSANAREAPSKC